MFLQKAKHQETVKCVLSFLCNIPVKIFLFENTPIGVADNLNFKTVQKGII